MRRKDREITDKNEIEKILKEAFVCHLGLTDGDQPYVVPLNYVYAEGCIYLHCASEGRKLDLIRANNKVCFEMEIVDPNIVKNGEQPCDWGTRFQSVIGSGRAVLLTEPEDKKNALKAIVGRFDDRDLSFHPGDFSATTVIRIDILEMAGKSANN